MALAILRLLLINKERKKEESLFLLEVGRDSRAALLPTCNVGR